jgi:hypothetical protein
VKLSAIVTPRRLAGHGAVAILIATVTAGGVAVAAGNKPPAASQSETSASAKRSAAAAGIQPDATPAAKVAAKAAAVRADRSSLLAAAHAGLQRLVADGTIDATQARTIEQQVKAGSVDASGLVSSGVVSDPQMQAVATMLDGVKRAAGR